MGTSSSYGGPVGSNSLLPPWAPPAPWDPTEEHPDDDDSEEHPDDNDALVAEESADIEQAIDRPSWSTAKTAMRQFAKGGGEEPRHLRSAARRFVRAQGGPRAAARASRSGTTTIINLGGALAAAARDGATGLAELFAREFVGDDAAALLSELVDAIAPDGATIEDAAARAAAAETLEKLFEEYAIAEEGLDVLSNLTEEAAAAVLQKYVETYVYTRLMQVLAKRIEEGATSAQNACSIEWQVRAYISELLRDEFTKRDPLAVDWSSPEAARMVENIFTDSYELLQTWQ